MFKLLSASLIIFITSSAIAGSVLTHDLKTQKSKGLKEKFTLEFVYATEQTKDSSDQKINGMYSSLKNSLLFSATKNDEFRIYASHVWEQYNDYTDNSYWELGEFMYRRKNILNPADHGVTLHTELKKYWVMDEETRKRWGFSGAFIPQVIVKKSISRNIGIKTKFRRHFFDKLNDKSSTLANEDRVYLSSYYMFNHSFMANVELKYRHKIYTDKHFSYRKFAYENKNVEITTLRPSLMYFVSRKAMIEAYVETVVADSSIVDRTNSELAQDEQVFGAAFYLTAF